MRVGSEGHSYDWIDNWAKLPESESSRKGWAHPGIVVTESGNVMTSHPGDPEVMTFDGGLWTTDPRITIFTATRTLRAWAKGPVRYSSRHWTVKWS